MTDTRRLALVHSRTEPPCGVASTRRSPNCPDGHRCILTEEDHRGSGHRCACRYSWHVVGCLACRLHADAADMVAVEHDAVDWVCRDADACTTRANGPAASRG